MKRAHSSFVWREVTLPEVEIERRHLRLFGRRSADQVRRPNRLHDRDAGCVMKRERGGPVAVAVCWWARLRAVGGSGL